MRRFQDTFGTGIRTCNLLQPESIDDWFTMKMHKLYSFTNSAKELYIHFIPNVGSNRLSDTI